MLAQRSAAALNRLLTQDHWAQTRLAHFAGQATLFMQQADAPCDGAVRLERRIKRLPTVRDH